MLYVFLVKAIDGYKSREHCYLLSLIRNNMRVFFMTHNNLHIVTCYGDPEQYIYACVFSDPESKTK